MSNRAQVSIGNWLTGASILVSSSKISRAEDIALDKSVPKKASGMAGLSIRNGPVENGDMDLDSPSTNGSKRKSRVSITQVDYKDESESDGEPLVGDALRTADGDDVISQAS
jgi:DNA topoisomerase-1